MDAGIAAVVAAAIAAVVALTSQVFSLRSSRTQAQAAAREARGQAETAAHEARRQADVEVKRAERVAGEQRQFYERQIDKILDFVSERSPAGSATSAGPLALEVVQAFGQWLEDLEAWLAGSGDLDPLDDPRSMFVLRLRRITGGLQIGDDRLTGLVYEDGDGNITAHRVWSGTGDELELMLMNIAGPGDDVDQRRRLVGTASALQQYLTDQAHDELRALGFVEWRDRP